MITGGVFLFADRANEKILFLPYLHTKNVRQNVPGIVVPPNRRSFLHFHSRLRNRCYGPGGLGRRGKGD
jgi:hypothetical protein